MQQGPRKQYGKHATMPVMSWLGLTMGAKGLIYYARRAPSTMPTSPVLWNELRTFAMQAAQVAPVLSRSNPTVLSAPADGFHSSAWQLSEGDDVPGAGDIIIVTVNPSAEFMAVSVSFQPSDQHSA